MGFRYKFIAVDEECIIRSYRARFRLPLPGAAYQIRLLQHLTAPTPDEPFCHKKRGESSLVDTTLELHDSEYYWNRLRFFLMPPLLC